MGCTKSIPMENDIKDIEFNKTDKLNDIKDIECNKTDKLNDIEYIIDDSIVKLNKIARNDNITKNNIILNDSDDDDLKKDTEEDILMNLQKEIISIELDDNLILNILSLLKKYISKLILHNNNLMLLQKIINIFDCNVYNIISNITIDKIGNDKKNMNAIIKSNNIFTLYNNERNNILQGLQLSSELNKNYLVLVEKNNEQMILLLKIFKNKLNDIRNNNVKNLKNLNIALTDMFYLYNLYMEIIIKTQNQKIIIDSYSLILSNFMDFISDIYFDYNKKENENFFIDVLPNTFESFILKIKNNVNTNNTLYESQLKIDIENVKNQIISLKNNLIIKPE